MSLYLAKVDLHQIPNKREKIIFFLTMFVFCFVFVKSCWAPSRKAMDTAKSELSGVMAEKEDLEQAIKRAPPGRPTEIKGGAFEVPVKYTKWARRAADNPDSVMMLEFSNPAVLRDVRMTGIEFADEKGKEEAGVISRRFAMKLSGPFTSVGGYLSRLEGLPILVIIDTIQLNADKTGSGRVDAVVSGVLYGWK